MRGAEDSEAGESRFRGGVRLVGRKGKGKGEGPSLVLGHGVFEGPPVDYPRSPGLAAYWLSDVGLLLSPCIC